MKYRWPATEAEADIWAAEALASFRGSNPCWEYAGGHDAFAEPLSRTNIGSRRRAVATVVLNRYGRRPTRGTAGILTTMAV